jgi:hypothetical protein
MAQQTDQRTRRETIQRIQVGLIGLSIVLLIVASTNIVVRTFRPDGGTGAAGSANPQLAAGAPNGAAALPQPDTEPLADLGVTPKAEQLAQDIASAPVGPSVPDLEPDPRLAKPMDQDPKKPKTAKPAGN